MTLKNAFEDLALDSSVQAIDATLQAGIEVDTGLSQPLTDAQLRASAVPVSGTFYPDTQPVSGTVTANIGTTNGVALDATLTGGTQRTKITDGTNNASIVQVGTQVTSSNHGVVTNAVIHGLTTGGGSGYVDVKVTPSGALVTDSTISGTVAISAAALPLPSGAATSANQSTANTSLSSIDGKLPALDGGYVPVTIKNASIEIANDSGNAIPVSGTVTANTGLSQPLTDTQLRASAVPVSGTFWQATQPVSFTRLSDSTDSVTIVPSGTQTVSGTVTANAGTGTFAVNAASLPLPTGAATSALQTTGNASLSSIDGKVPTLVQGTTPALVYGISEGGNDVLPISVSDEGHLEVALQSPASVFGEVIVGGLYPLAQGDFAYGLNANTVSSSVTGSGTATSTNQMAVASTTAATNSSATVRSVRTAKYRAGQGINARYTAMFTAGVANSTQTAGLFNAQDGYAFGYNGTSFGVIYRRNSVDVWTAQASFNLDPLDGTGRSGMTIDPTKINIYRMQIGYLGVFGCVFSVLNPLNGQWVECHRTTTANTATTPQFINPTMWWQISAVNTTNNTNVVVRSASFGVFLEGERKRLGGIYGTQNFKSISTTATNVLTLRCNTTLNGVTNNSIIRIRSLSVATAANVPVIFQAIKNTTLGGTPTYNNIDATNSMAAIDTAGTTVTGGTIVFNTSTGGAGNAFCDLTDFDIQLQPGETLTITANSISGAAANQVVAINWSEDT